MTKWVSAIFILVLVPAFANINVCIEDECFDVPNDKFLELEKNYVMEELTSHYPIACDIISSHPLGIFSWFSDFLIQPHCDQLREREIFRYFIGVSIREDFENFARSCKSFKLAFSSNKELVQDFPKITVVLSDLEHSLDEVDNKNSELDKSIKKFDEFKLRSLSTCASLIDSLSKNLAKEGKKTLVSNIKKWSKEAVK